ncbi:MAG: response regulator transcription factor [Myxococcales bacterium]|nr:response regulator transcription factor [Myxococcales bacterium]
MTRILVVEDDASIRLGLEDTLSAKGYDVDAVTRGDVGLARAKEMSPDLIVLDIMLPDMDGFEVCRRLKADESLRGIPVIILSARGAELDRVRGLELGADDYVTKPFSLMELLARVSAVLRRSGRGEGGAAERMVFGDVVVNFRSHTATKAGNSVELPTRGYAILRTLASRPGEVVSREELMNEAWGYDKYPNTRTVDNHIVKLRKVLEDETESPVYLRTVHGAGYRFVPDE